MRRIPAPTSRDRRRLLPQAPLPHRHPGSRHHRRQGSHCHRRRAPIRRHHHQGNHHRRPRRRQGPTRRHQGRGSHHPRLGSRQAHIHRPHRRASPLQYRGRRRLQGPTHRRHPGSRRPVTLLVDTRRHSRPPGSNRPGNTPRRPDSYLASLVPGPGSRSIPAHRPGRPPRPAALPRCGFAHSASVNCWTTCSASTGATSGSWRRYR